MKTLVNYTLHDYFRSHKYFPPLSTFIIMIFVYYSYSANPIIDSYAVTALMVFIISTWLCISVLSLDSPVQRQVMVLHIRGKNRYYLSKFTAIWLLSFFLSAFAFIYPIVFGLFNERVTLAIGLVSVGNYLLLSMLGIAVASLFSNVIMKNTVNSYGGLALAVTISMTALGLFDVLPSPFRYIMWLIPPALITQKPLLNWNGENIFHLSALPFLWIFLYAIVLISIFCKLVKHKA